MLRLIAGPLLLAVLAAGGLAMAQDELVVDPWQRVVGTVVGSANEPPVAAPAPPRPVGVASFPIEDPPTKPQVVPIGPPLALANTSAAVVPIGPATHDQVFDPWPTAPANVRTSSRLVTSHSGQRDWAFEIDEIVDPWSKGPLVAVTDPLIVDPWAR